MLRTPVDTGRFRANWNVSLTKPDLTTTQSTNQSRGASEAAKALKFSAGGVVYMANGLPYAVRLEHGWSNQAPTGMVKVSIVEFEKQLRAALRSK